MNETAHLAAFLADVASGGSQGTLTYGLEHLLELEGAERQRGEALLCDLASEGDARAIETLGLGRCLAGERLLEDLLARRDDTGLAAARALLALRGPSEAIVERIAGGIAACGDLQAVLAAFDLRGLRSAAAVRGLLAALVREPKAARANAMLGLDDAFSLEPLREHAQSPLQSLTARAMLDIPALWRPAARDLAERISRVAAGETAEAAGLAWAPGSQPEALRRFEEAMAESRLDLDSFASLAGADRDWAISALLVALDLDGEETADLALLVTAARDADVLLELRCVIEEPPAFLRGLERDAARREIAPALLGRLAGRLAARDPELLFDAAVALAAQGGAGRAAFLDGVAAADASWFGQHGSALAEALDVPAHTSDAPYTARP